MNIEGKDADSEHDPNFRIRAKLLSTSSGAGVNAGSKVNQAFATCDPLSELVWTPKSGLGLKCANFRADDSRKPFLLWNVGLKPVVDQGSLIVSQMVLDANDIIIENATVLKDSDGLESDRELGEEADAKDGVLERNVVISESREEDAASKELESSAENDLCHLTEKDECSLVGPELPIKNTLPIEGLCESSKICLYQEKEKGKALSDENIYRRSSDDEDDNHESASSNSLLFSQGKKGIKRQIFDEDAVTGSKRTKMQIHGSNTKPYSSFMKWISNMTRGGLSNLNLEDSLSPLPLACSDGVLSKKYHENFMCFRPRDSANLSMGFQTVFQSLYCTEKDASKKIVESTEEESREHEVDDERSPEDLRESDERIFGNSSEQTITGSKEDDIFRDPSEIKNRVIRADPLDEETKAATRKAYPDIPLATSDVLGRGNHHTSLWITRLYTKTRRSEKGKEILVEADLDDSNVNVEGREESVDLKSVNELCTVLPSRRFSSEAMASDFARRLDALKHITSSRKGIYVTCLYCGGCHDVRECLSVTRSELEDLLLKSSAFDSRVNLESSCLCIRCSKPDHWAVSCPMGPGFRFSARRLMLCGGEDQSLRPCDTSNVNNNAANSEIFYAIRSLRLTRVDILRWMNSNVPSSHLNGFFLRLRLGSVEAGLVESSYYVACISGDDVRGNTGCMLKKSISVDVGGIKSSVASQYVSNHDFLEEEIKAWWSRTVGNGCRLPSLAELNLKLNDRQTLGF